MPREKVTTAATTQTVEIQTQRVTSLEPRTGMRLTSLEEAVVRMHHGVSVRADAKLPTHGFSEELMARLLDMEVDAFEKSGRADDVEDVPAAATANAQTQRIVSELQKRLDDG